MSGRTIDQALDRFTLVDGEGDGESTASAMSLLSWVHGDPFGDAPECAHRMIRSLVIRVNDAEGTTPEDRARIVRAGEHGVLDTWWIPTEVVLRAVAEARALLPDGGDVDQLVATLDLITLWQAGDRDPASADLTGADLSGANLARANLIGANLTGAYLTGAYLTGAYLARAYLTGAYLIGAYLIGAYLARANLTGANLTGANLARANLTGANLTGSRRYDSDAAIPGWTVVDGRLERAK